MNVKLVVFRQVDTNMYFWTSRRLLEKETPQKNDTCDRSVHNYVFVLPTMVLVFVFCYTYTLKLRAGTGDIQNKHTVLMLGGLLHYDA